MVADVIKGWLTILALAFANGAIALTVTKSKFFAGMRAWLSLRTSRPGKFAYDLLSCPYCFSHWLAFAAVILWQPKLTSVRLDQPGLSYIWLADYLVSIFALVSMSSWVAGRIFSLFKDKEKE